LTTSPKASSSPCGRSNGHSDGLTARTGQLLRPATLFQERSKRYCSLTREPKGKCSTTLDVDRSLYNMKMQGTQEDFSMDFVAIATGFLALVGPYVTGVTAVTVATGALKKVAETGAVDLYQSIKGLLAFKPHAKASLENFEAKQPGSENALIKEIANLLEANPDIRDLVVGIVEKNKHLVAQMLDQSTSTISIGKITMGPNGVLTTINSVDGPVTINSKREG
jgi:hypothetical protein